MNACQPTRFDNPECIVTAATLCGICTYMTLRVEFCNDFSHYFRLHSRITHSMYLNHCAVTVKRKHTDVQRQQERMMHRLETIENPICRNEIFCFQRIEMCRRSRTFY